MSIRNIDLVRSSSGPKTGNGNTNKNLTAIVVDSDELESGIVASLLRKRGYKVVQVSSAASALRVSAERVDLVVATLDLPDMNGSQLLQRMRRLKGSAEAPFLFISPQGQTPDQQLGHETFADDYVQRPLDPEEFERRLDRMFRRNKLHVMPIRVPAPPVIDALAPKEYIYEASRDVAPLEIDTANSLTDSEVFSRNDASPAAAALYRDAFQFLTRSTSDLLAGGRIDLVQGSSVTMRIVAQLAVDKSLVKVALDRTSEFSFRSHSINVAIIGARIAQTLGWSDARVNHVTLAGLLHDIGTVKLPLSLTMKSGFGDKDRAEMKRRPLFSASLVSGTPGFEWMPDIVAQVYERENGQGYPHGLKGPFICEEAKILAVADVFEACIHQRPQRPALTGYRALEIITSEVDSFSEPITKAMMRSFSVYPYNEHVVLNTGEIAVVTDINADNPLRPVVKVLYSLNGVLVPVKKIVNLARNSQLWIAAALTVAELPQQS